MAIVQGRGEVFLHWQQYLQVPVVGLTLGDPRMSQAKWQSPVWNQVCFLGYVRLLPVVHIVAGTVGQPWFTSPSGGGLSDHLSKKKPWFVMLVDVCGVHTLLLVSRYQHDATECGGGMRCAQWLH